jgi:hypothetical protein
MRAVMTVYPLWVPAGKKLLRRRISTVGIVQKVPSTQPNNPTNITTMVVPFAPPKAWLWLWIRPIGSG